MSSKSSLRLAQHAALRNVKLEGNVLDVGGDRQSEYHRLMPGNRRVVFANISPATDPDMIFDAQLTWPVEDATYDAVVLSNVLEHLYSYQSTVSEAHRAIKPGGKIVVTVPFLFYVHASPSDYFRYTQFALHRIFEDAGFVDIAIVPLGTGIFSAAWQTLQGPLPAPLVSVGRSAASGLDWFASKLKRENRLGPDHYPLGFLLVASK